MNFISADLVMNLPFHKDTLFQPHKANEKVGFVSPLKGAKFNQDILHSEFYSGMQNFDSCPQFKTRTRNDLT